MTLSDKSVNGVYGDMEFTNGVATFSLRHGEVKTASQLSADITYTVEETPHGEYKVTVPTNANGTITAHDIQRVNFVNTFITGDLTVTKTVTGDGADMSEKFAFTVMLSDTSINGGYGEMSFVNGVATFQLGHQESATAVGLPAGIRYDVSETSKGYTVTSTGETGTITANTTAKAEFVNNKMLERGDLKVYKTITGSGADVTQKFTFRVSLDDPSINGTYGDMTFANGVATFQLGHDESATAKQLPAGTGYEVEELDYEDYEVTTTSATGVVNGKLTTFVTFINNRDQFDVPETGDQSPLMLYAAMMVISAGILTVLKRKTNKA